MGAEDFVGPKIDIEVVMSLKSKTPVVGCEINPSVRVNGYGSGQPPPHTLYFTWYRENSVSGQQTAVIDVQEGSSLESHLSVPDISDIINPLCLSNEMAQENHTAISPLHAVSNALPHVLSYQNLIDVKGEGITWIKLGSSRSYIPSSDDVGLTLKLECVPVDHSTGIHLSPVFVMLTDPVILFPAPCPRCMISVGSAMKYECSSSQPQSTSGINFTVLSYNILADLYASRNAHQSTPAWALAWEYRSQNLLNEIIGYNSDIICLQEVQSDHFDTFFQPEMEQHGYSSVYKKKTKEAYHLALEGALLYRSNRKMIVEELDPGIAGPTQVKDLTAEIAADPSTFDGRELPKQPALKPKCLFPPPEGPPEDQPKSLKDTRQRDKKRKSVSDQRFRIQTSRGKNVLSSDMRLHLEKKERLKAQNQENPKEPEEPFDSNEELELLERETRRLQAKLERKCEIHRLRRELQQTTIQNKEQDDEFYDEDDDAEYEYEPSAESTYSQPRERRQRTVSSAEVSRQTESTEPISHEEFAKMQEEIAKMRNIMRNQLGFETVSENPIPRSVRRIFRPNGIPQHIRRTNGFLRPL
ncbi:hypothetical protein AgCh_023316 [Apium graveolens]